MKSVLVLCFLSLHLGFLFNIQAQTTVDELRNLALEIGHYINHDWPNDDADSRKTTIMDYLGGLDTITTETGITMSKLSRFFEVELFAGWSKEELEEDISGLGALIEMLYGLSFYYIEEYQSASPLKSNNELVNFLIDEESVKFAVAFAVLIREKKTEDFLFLLDDNEDLRHEREEIESEAFTRGAGNVFDERLGASILFALFFYVAN